VWHKGSGIFPSRYIAQHSKKDGKGAKWNVSMFLLRGFVEAMAPRISEEPEDSEAAALQPDCLVIRGPHSGRRPPNHRIRAMPRTFFLGRARGKGNGAAAQRQRMRLRHCPDCSACAGAPANPQLGKMIRERENRRLGFFELNTKEEFEQQENGYCRWAENHAL